jgi:hypothetical protein
MGQSRKAAVRSRLEAMEKFFDALTSRSKGEAEQLLNEIRQTNDLAAVFNVDRLLVQPEKALPSPLARSPPSSTDGVTSGDERAIFTDSGRGTPISTTTTQAGDSSDATSPSPTLAAMESMRLPVFPVLPDHFVRAAMPRPEVIQKATGNFHRLSGELFHIFSREQMKELHEVAFYRHDAPEADKKAALCGLSIVASIGVAYDPKSFGAGLDKVLYDISRHFFAQFLENDSLDAIKICVLLAMSNIMNKGSAALAYLALGLAMCQRHGLHGHYEDSSLTPDLIKDYRRTWRLLMFFST